MTQSPWKFSDDDEASDAVRLQRLAFLERFGRPPGQDDPVFFDPDGTVPARLPDGEAADRIVLATHEAGLTWVPTGYDR